MIIKELTLDALKPFIPSRMQVSGKAYRAIYYHFIEGLSVRAASLQVGFSQQCGNQAIHKVHEKAQLAGLTIDSIKVLRH